MPLLLPSPSTAGLVPSPRCCLVAPFRGATCAAARARWSAGSSRNSSGAVSSSWSSSAAGQLHGARRRLRRARVRAEPEQQQQLAVEGLPTDPCDDFVCTSSPAVEQTVRSLASSIKRFKYNTNFFQPDVTYSDGFRSFKGSENYRLPAWVREGVAQPRASVTRMAMLDNSKAAINWLLAGQVSGFNVCIPMTSTFELNLVTGRVTSHTESWDLSKLAPPAAAACVASRVLWSAKAAGRDAGDKLGKAAESLSSLASFEDEDEYTMNPNDPTRFFQQNDTTKNDAIMVAMAVAGLYLVFKVFEALETMPK